MNEPSPRGRGRPPKTEPTEFTAKVYAALTPEQKKALELEVIERRYSEDLSPRWGVSDLLRELVEAHQQKRNPTLSEDAAERFARIAHVVDPPPWDAAAPEPLTGGGGDFGGAGATASYDPPAADPAPSCDPSPSYDTSSSCDSGGGYSGGGDL